MKKGFTLVELLVVVAILGILAAVGIVSFGGFLNSSKTTACKTNHTQVVNFIETYWLKCMLNPDTNYEDLVLSNGKTSGNACISTNNSWASTFHDNFEGTGWKNPFNSNGLAVSMEYDDAMPTILGKTNLTYSHNPKPSSMSIKTRCGEAAADTYSKTLYYE